MALSTLAIVILSACGTTSPTSVASPATSTTPTPPVFGLDYGPYTVGDGPGDMVPDSRVEQLLTVLKGKVRWIKVPGASAGNTNVPRIAHGMGFKVVATAYITGDPKVEEAELKQLKIDIDNKWIDVAVLGSESIWVKAKTAPDLEAELDHLRTYIHGRLPLTTVEPNVVWIQHPDLVQHVDLVMANITPFSYQKPFNEALSYVNTSYAELVNKTHKEVWIGETEWATQGGLFGQALANPETAANYFTAIEKWSRGNKVKMFYFEAFDEPWLGKLEPPFGDHWGVFTKDGSLKEGMDRGFSPP